jgi:hypothetical protein
MTTKFEATVSTEVTLPMGSPDSAIDPVYTEWVKKLLAVGLTVESSGIGAIDRTK